MSEHLTGALCAINGTNAMSWKTFYTYGKLKLMLLTIGVALPGTVIFLNFSLGVRHVARNPAPVFDR